MDSQAEEIELLRADIAALEHVRKRLEEKLQRLSMLNEATHGFPPKAREWVPHHTAQVVDIFAKMFGPQKPPPGEIA